MNRVICNDVVTAPHMAVFPILMMINFLCLFVCVEKAKSRKAFVYGKVWDLWCGLDGVGEVVGGCNKDEVEIVVRVHKRTCV